MATIVEKGTPGERIALAGEGEYEFLWLDLETNPEESIGWVLASATAQSGSEVELVTVARALELAPELRAYIILKTSWAVSVNRRRAERAVLELPEPLRPLALDKARRASDVLAAQLDYARGARRWTGL